MLKADHPFSLVLFGASGHLAKIKLFPSLYFLALKKRLPEQYVIVGYARTTKDDNAFRKEFADAVLQSAGEVNQKVVDELLTHVHYHTGQYDNVKDFEALATKLKGLEKGWKRPVRLAYLSIPPTAYTDVLRNLCKGGIHDHSHEYADFRCIVEKPVGHDGPSYQQIHAELYGCLRPEEVFILDHYLGKEAVRNVYYLRYANPVIERLLKNTIINNVQITASETAGLEGRAGYFEAVGTLRDFVQSHLLQIAALLTMRLLGDGNVLKAARLDALRKFYLPPASDLSQVVIQAQYDEGEISGKKLGAYRKEEGIKVGTRTPTYAAMKLTSRSSRWAGVPIFLRSGKRLKAKETRIAIEFQESMFLDRKDTPRNRLDIILLGEAGLKFYLRTKMGGSEAKFRPLIMEDSLVCVGDCLPEHSLLILEAINGNQLWFLDPQEVQVCWDLIDPLQKYLDNPKTPVHLYPSGSTGPETANKFIETNGLKWLE